MLQPITIKTLKTLCQGWSNVLKSGENAVQVLPPIGGVYLRIKQLLENPTLKNELFLDTQIVVFDGEERDELNFADFEQEVVRQLKISSIEYLLLSKKILIFVTNIDDLFKKGDLKFIKKLGSEVRKNPNISIILCTELSIHTYNFFEKLQGSVFLQNILYRKIYGPEDCLQFIKYLENRWKLKLNQEFKQFVVKSIGGHLLLIKEAIRIKRDQLNIPNSELLSGSILKKKALTLFNLLSQEDQSQIKNLLSYRPYESSEYLEKTEIVKEGLLQIYYWNFIKNDILQLGGESLTDQLSLILSPSEKRIYDHLTTNKGIVSREEIAFELWGSIWEEKYSDWAIDMLIYRLRSKIKSANLNLKIHTKRGQGFVLQSV